MSVLARYRKDSARPESPPVENENPFKNTEALEDNYPHFSLNSEVLTKNNQLTNDNGITLREKRSGVRMVQSMFVESSCFNEALPDQETFQKRKKPRHVLSNSSYAMPYNHSQTSLNQSLLSLQSLHCKTLDDRRVRRLPMSHYHATHNLGIQDLEAENQESVQIQSKECLDISDQANEVTEETREDNKVDSLNLNKDETYFERSKNKKNIFNIFNIVMRSKFRKSGRPKEGKEERQFVKQVKTSFGNSDFPFLHTLA